MSYEMVKEVLNKVVEIKRGLDSLSTEEIASRYNFDEGIPRAEMIDKVILRGLSEEERDIYIKYLEFYRSQKNAEMYGVVSALSDGIDRIVELYDKRQALLGKKANLQEEKHSTIMNIKGLPWIRAKIQFSRLEAEHKRYVSEWAAGVVSESKVSDEKESILESNFLVRGMSKKRVTRLEEQEAQIRARNERKSKVLERKVKGEITAYIDIIKCIVRESLKNNVIVTQLRKRYDLAGDELESVVLDDFMTYVFSLESKREESLSALTQEDVFYPVNKLDVADPDKYMDYYVQFVSTSIDIEIGRTLCESSRIMSDIRRKLLDQKEAYATLNDSMQEVMPTFTVPTAEENRIFAKVYKESKK